MPQHHYMITTTLTCLLISTAALTGCTNAGNSDSTPTTAAPSSATAPGNPTSTSPSTSTAPTTNASVTASASTAPSATAPATALSPCTTTDLNVQFGPGAGAGMSQQRLTLTFTNTGITTCTLNGHPGVSFVTGDDGHQVGAPAQRGGEPTRVVLASAATAHANLDIVNTAAFDPAICQPTPVTGLRIYPPDQTASAFLAYPATGCTSTDTALNVLNIGPVQEGAGTPS